MECRVHYNNTEVKAKLGKQTFLETFYIDHQSSKGDDGQVESIFIHPKEEITLQKIEINIPIEVNSSTEFFCNGYQSWSESYLLDQQRSIPKLRFGSTRFFKFYGDDQFEETKEQALYSWTYAYLKTGKKVHFFGSLSEHINFTLFVYKPSEKLITATAICDNIKLAHSFPAMKLFHAVGDEQEVFDQYFNKIESQRAIPAPSFGWTSWYKHLNKIEFTLIDKELDDFIGTLPKLKNKAEDIFFQVDDGYQKKVGDWLDVKDSFKKKMPGLTAKIKKAKMHSGIWIAPFICEEQSDLFKNKKDWLLKDENGKPIKVGTNPLWSGAFYALDIYNKAFRNYLIEVFFTFFNKWYFDLVKVDFLFAAAVFPRKNKTRGQQMHDAMAFINELCKGKKILACGVPLGPAFGMVDYCRTGADTHVKWEHKLLKFINKRERVSTISALRSTLSRWQLNKRAFISDPDVFLLRKEKNDLSLDQQYTLLLVNVLLGGQLFTSDNLSEYEEEQISELDNLLYYQESNILSVIQKEEDLYQIDFKKDQHGYKAIVSLSSKKKNFSSGKINVELDPYESMIFKN